MIFVCNRNEISTEKKCSVNALLCQERILCCSNATCKILGPSALS